MSFSKKTIRDIDLKGKKVLLRVDFNVPLDDKGHIIDDYRIKKSLPTIEYLLKQNCRIVICSHLGRPEGRVDSRLSLKPCAKELSKLLAIPVKFAESSTGDKTRQQVEELKSGEVLLLENIRFNPGEELKDKHFTKQLASYGDIFVQDAFGVVHHGAASVSEVPKIIPGVAGLLLETEVDTIGRAMEDPKRPLMAIIGGSKISDKIDVLNRFIDIADIVVVGGAMANTFLLAKGLNIGKSKAEPNEVPLAKQIIKRAQAKSDDGNFVFYLPQDGVVAKNIASQTTTRIVDYSANVIANIQAYPRVAPRESGIVKNDEAILDIGPFSGAFIAGAMQLAGTVVWNGTMGVTETEAIQGPVGPFAHGTELIIEAMIGEYGNRPFTILGGGDTVAYIEERKLTECFNHVSTGGGASMELMSGKPLPGVEALQDKE